MKLIETETDFYGTVNIDVTWNEIVLNYENTICLKLQLNKFSKKKNFFHIHEKYVSFELFFHPI